MNYKNNRYIFGKKKIVFMPQIIGYEKESPVLSRGNGIFGI